MPARCLQATIQTRSLARYLRDGLIVAGISLTAFVGAVASLPGEETPGRPIALVYPPWLSKDEAVARSLAAGHAVLRSGASPFIVIVAPLAADAIRPSRPEGAWLMLGLAGLAGCLDTASPREASS
ncbi:hypothetical protein DWF00_17005 [Bosea caraganae]|uniref:Uncharacterized protein n=1 Tax=Bosea caraganae TaxID=2763117 RepID=A0A370L7K4_9HYPH|nr:hypothetical protein [Bosea caraganae]RDJ24915.1 hypothetical protein DWF00_17005 [Bosea caraganae]RDJ26027.1 hypothetical protein DWE98_09225 [Bosea caraganae]